MKKALTLVLTLVLAASVGATAHVGWRTTRPAIGDDRVAAQVAFVADALDDGAGADMQALFPEGEFFTAALAGMAAANLAHRDPGRRTWALAHVERALGIVDTPAVRHRFGQMRFEHGIFYRGWRAHLLVDRALLTQAPADVEAATTEARAIADALGSEPSGFVESYPGQRWPCDAVVAMAAAARADRAWPLGGFLAVRDAWLHRIDVARDAAHGGLLAHHVDAAGRPTGGVRGTSQSIIQAFWPDILPHDVQPWLAFREHLLTRELGLLGVREYPRDEARQPGDVDSGPLVLGVSLSASATALAGARRWGDDVVWEGLDREAELFGLLLGQDRRSFALGLMPVGDAFVAWARSVPRPAASAALPAAEPTDAQLRPRLWPWGVAAALPGVVAVGGLTALGAARAGRGAGPARTRPGLSGRGAPGPGPRPRR